MQLVSMHKKNSQLSSTHIRCKVQLNFRMNWPSFHIFDHLPWSENMTCMRQNGAFIHKLVRRDRTKVRSTPLEHELFYGSFSLSYLLVHFKLSILRCKNLELERESKVKEDLRETQSFKSIKHQERTPNKRKDLYFRCI